VQQREDLAIVWLHLDGDRVTRKKAIEAGALIEDPATGMPEPRPAIEPPPRLLRTAAARKPRRSRPNSRA
jgi:hypothetical protein